MQTAEFRHVFACVYVRLHSVQRHFCVESKQFPCGRRETAEPSCLKALCVWSCTSSDTTKKKNFPSFFPSPHLYLCVFGDGVLNCFFCASYPEWLWNEERELILTRQRANHVSAPWASLFKMILMENIFVWVRDKEKGGKLICFCFFHLSKKPPNYPHNSGARKESFSSEAELIKLSWQFVWLSALFDLEFSTLKCKLHLKS